MVRLVLRTMKAEGLIAPTGMGRGSNCRSNFSKLTCLVNCRPAEIFEQCPQFASLLNVLVRVPRPVISISTLSPAFIFGDVPSVPIQITSPG